MHTITMVKDFIAKAEAVIAAGGRVECVESCDADHGQKDGWETANANGRLTLTIEIYPPSTSRRP